MDQYDQREADGKETCYISRQGFRGWYPTNTMRHLLENAQTTAAQLKGDAAHLESLLEKSQKKYDPKAKPVAQPVKTRPQVQRKNIQKNTHRKTRPNQDPAPNHLDLEKFNVTVDDLDPNLDRFVISGRLRLGQSRSPFKSAIIKFLASLGFYWFDWFATACHEVSWHTDHHFRSPRIKHPWLCLIPGLHILMTMRLASEVRRMEQQNCYQATRPGVACALSLCPPLAIIYLQSALNSHWDKHLTHEMQQQER